MTQWEWKKFKKNSVGTVKFNYKMTGDVKIYCYLTKNLVEMENFKCSKILWDFKNGKDFSGDLCFPSEGKFRGNFFTEDDFLGPKTQWGGGPIGSVTQGCKFPHVYFVPIMMFQFCLIYSPDTKCALNWYIVHFLKPTKSIF